MRKNKLPVYKPTPREAERMALWDYHNNVVMKNEEKRRELLDTLYRKMNWNKEA